jgi:hypothetical protein
MRGVIRVILAEPEVYPGEFMDPAYYDGAYGDDTATRLWWPMLAADQDLEDLLGFKVFAQYDPETFDAALKAWTEHLDDPADL